LGLAYLWAARKIDPKVATTSHYFRNVGRATYGDDNIVVPSAKVAHVCNYIAFRDAFKEHGVDFTPASKEDADPAPLKSLLDCQFLKLATRVDSIVPGVTYYPSPYRADLLPTLCFVSKDLPPLEAVAQNVDDVLRRSFGWGQVRFEEFRQELYGYLRQVGVHDPPISWDSCKALWMEGCLDPDESYDKESDVGVGYGKTVAYLRSDFAKAYTEYRGTPQMDGVSFVSSEETRLESADRVDEKSLDDNDEVMMDYSRVLAREQFITGVNYNTSAQRGEIIADFEAPWSFIRNSANFAVRSFVYMRGTMRFRVQLQSQPFQCGKVVVAFLPMVKSGVEADLIANDRTSLLLNPHIMLDAGATREAILEIPFQHFLKKLDPRNIGDYRRYLGTIVVVAFNQLYAGVAATGTALTAPLSIWFSMKNVDLQVLDPNGGSFFDGVPQMGAGISLIRKATNVANAAVDTIDYAQERGREALGDRDYPNVGAVVPIVREPAPDLANVGGVNTARVLDAHSHQIIDTSSSVFSASKDEMNLRYLAAKRTLYRTFNWDVNAPGETVLFVAPLCPAPVIYAMGDQEIRTPTMSGFVCFPFEFWRCTIEVTIEVLCTKFHTGRLGIISHYGRTSAQYGSLAQASGQYLTVFDVTPDKSTITVSFPFKSIQEWLRVPDLRSIELPLLEVAMGEMSVRVINPLVAPSDTVPGTVDVNVYWAVKDLELKFPRMINPNVRIDSYPVSGVPQMELDVGRVDLQEDEKENLSTQVIAPMSRPRGPTPNRDEELSVQMLIKRSAPLGFAFNTGTVVFPLGRILAERAAVTNRGHLGYWSNIYRFWKGSFRFRFLGNQDLLVAWTPDPSSQDQIGLSAQYYTATGAPPGMGPVAFGQGSSGILDIQIPYQSPYDCLLTPFAEGDDSRIECSPGAVSYTVAKVENYAGFPGGGNFVAAGDDFVFGVVYRLPTFQKLAN